MVPLAVLALGFIWWRERETPWLLLVSTLLLVGFGSLTIATDGDPVWLKVKLTAVSLVYAAGLGITWLLGFPLLKKLMGQTLEASDSVWLERRWLWLWALWSPQA